MTADFDFSELTAFGDELAKAPVKAVPNIRKAVEFTARGVKDTWRKSANGRSRSLHAYPAAINYDMQLDSDGSIGAEIGPVLGGQGSFGLVEDAPGGVRSAARHDDRAALKANERDFYDGLEKALGDSL